MEKKEYYEPAVETIPQEEREKRLNEKIRWIVQYAYQNAPAIKEKLDKAGVTPQEICTLKDLGKIPITSKDEFSGLQKANPPFGGFLTIPKEGLGRIFVSPGPTYDPDKGEESAVMLARAFYAGGLREGDTVLNTVSYHLVVRNVH